MYEQNSQSSSIEQPASNQPRLHSPARPWSGPERRRQTDETQDDRLNWRFQLLDEIDYGIFVLSAQSKLLYANQVALACLNSMAVLREENGALVTTSLRDTVALGTPACRRRSKSRTVMTQSPSATALNITSPEESLRATSVCPFSPRNMTSAAITGGSIDN